MSTAQASLKIGIYSEISTLDEYDNILREICADIFMQDSRVSSTNVRIYHLENKQDLLGSQCYCTMCSVHN